jgi:hypothetical protein
MRQFFVRYLRSGILSCRHISWQCKASPTTQLLRRRGYTWSIQTQWECLVDWRESTVIITKATDCYRRKATTAVLYSEGRMRLVPVALYANGCPRWHIINSITNLSNNPRKPLVKQRQSSERDFVVVLLLTETDGSRRWGDTLRHYERNASSQFYSLTTKSSKFAEAVTVLICNLQMPISNFGRDTD